MLLAYPYETMATVIELHNPLLQDVLAIATGVKIKTMMDGSLRTRRKTPATTRLSFHWTELTRTKAVELESFLEASAGSYIRLIDFNDVIWKGKILTNPYTLTVGSRGKGITAIRHEATEVSLDFEGVMIG